VSCESAEHICEGQLPGAPAGTRLERRACVPQNLRLTLSSPLATREGYSSARTVRGVTWKPRAERGHRVLSDVTEPRAGSHYVPDGTVHAVDDLTGEVACGFDGELIEIEASWESPAVASLTCEVCAQVIDGKS
jgi:hypothetical protein